MLQHPGSIREVLTHAQHLTGDWWNSPSRLLLCLRLTRLPPAAARRGVPLRGDGQTKRRT